MKKQMRDRSHTAQSAFRNPQSAFTLLELLIVIGIISVLLVAVIPAVNSLSKSSGRKATISNLLGAFEQARTQAIKDGQPTYVVFPTFSSGAQTTIDRYNYKSYAIFENDPANTSTPKQLTTWKLMPSGIALRSKGGSSLNSLTQASALSPAPTFAFSPDLNAMPAFQCLKFNANGEVESPPSNIISLAAFEGSVDTSGNEVITGPKDSGGNPLAVESLNIAHLTGRASRQ
jgi:prepilin-type N-terminal cleavage/methylation domain-containing protein